MQIANNLNSFSENNVYKIFCFSQANKVVNKYHSGYICISNFVVIILIFFILIVTRIEKLWLNPEFLILCKFDSSVVNVSDFCFFISELKPHLFEIKKTIFFLFLCLLFFLVLFTRVYKIWFILFCFLLLSS